MAYFSLRSVLYPALLTYKYMSDGLLTGDLGFYHVVIIAKCQVIDFMDFFSLSDGIKL